MRKLLYFLTMLICLTSCESCERDYPEINFQLPEETRTGANTIGFMFGNEVWMNYGEACNPYGCDENPETYYALPNPYNSMKYYFSLNSVKRIRENKVDRLFQHFGFDIERLDSLKTYNLDGVNYKNWVSFYDQISDKNYRLHPERPNFTVTFTRLDSTAFIFSGRFEGVLFNELDLTDSVLIRQGRFDLGPR
jgi:hypothetical protein